MNRALRYLSVVAIVAITGVSVDVSTSFAAKLDPPTFKACGALPDLREAPKAAAMARYERSFEALDSKRAKSLAQALGDASKPGERKKAVQAAYTWCDETMGAFELTTVDIPGLVTGPQGPTKEITGATFSIEGVSTPGAKVVLSRYDPGATPTVVTSTKASRSDGSFALPVTGLPIGETRFQISAEGPLRLPKASIVVLRRVETEDEFKSTAKTYNSAQLRTLTVTGGTCDLESVPSGAPHVTGSGVVVAAINTMVIRPTGSTSSSDVVGLIPAPGVPVAAVGSTVQYWGYACSPFSLTFGSPSVPRVVVKYLTVT